MKPLFLSVRLLAVAFSAVLLGSCTEKLDNSGVCSILCPPVGGEVQNITLDAIPFDTTVQALSGLGAEEGLLLSSRGDTLDARVIVRYDSMPVTYSHGGSTSIPIVLVDSVTVRLLLDTLSTKATAPVTIEAYDVDTTANDTSTAAVIAMFRPDRLINSQTFSRAQLRDTIRYTLPSDFVLAKIQNQQRLRLGFRAVSNASAQILIRSGEGGGGPLMRFRVSADTLVQPFTLTPFSKTPTDDELLLTNLGDYTVFARRPPDGSPTELHVGGFPPRRTYLRFDIPQSILDSSTVIRATLLLNQIPNPLLDPTDSVIVVPELILAGASVTDPTKAAQIFTDFGPDTLKTRPGESGLKLIEIGRAFTVWQAIKASEMPHAILLRSSTEGRTPLAIRFSSREAAPAERPRLRISYTNDVPLGLP